MIVNLYCDIIKKELILMEEMMAESKKTSAQQEQERLEFAETLRRAAEILEGAANQPAEEQPTPAPAKKPAAKKPAAKKPAAKSGTSKSSTTKSGTSKAPAKKPTTKKPATKAAPKKVEEPKAEEVEQPVVTEQPAPQPEPTPVTEPVVEQKTEEPAPAPVAEQKAEEPVAEQKVEQPKQEEPVKEDTAPAPAAETAQGAKGKKTDAFMNKSSDFINNKGKLPLWIVANALLLLTSVFLIIGAFNISYVDIYGYSHTQGYSVFQYFASAENLKYVWQGTAGEWANGGYVMIGILMIFSFLVPLALIAKNVVFFVLKKDKKVHMLDAIISFAFLIAYLGVVNLYGANMTWAHILALIMAIVLLAYTIFVILIENREGQFPFYSIANILLILLCTFLLTSNKIYAAAGWYAAAAAGHSGGGGFALLRSCFCLLCRSKSSPVSSNTSLTLSFPQLQACFRLSRSYRLPAASPTACR